MRRGLTRAAQKRSRSSSSKAAPACAAWLTRLSPVRRQSFEYELDVCARVPVWTQPRMPVECQAAAETFLAILPTLMKDNLRLVIAENLGLDHVTNESALCAVAAEMLLPDMLVSSAAHFNASQHGTVVFYNTGRVDIDRLKLQAQQCEWATAAAQYASDQFRNFYAAFSAFVLSPRNDDSPMCWATAEDVLRAVCRRTAIASQTPTATALLVFALSEFSENRGSGRHDSNNDLAMEVGMEFIELLKDAVPPPAFPLNQSDAAFAKSTADVDAHLCELFCRPRSEAHVIRAFMQRHMGLRLLSTGVYSVAPLVHQMLSIKALHTLYVRPRPHPFSSEAARTGMQLRKAILDALQAAHGGLLTAHGVPYEDIGPFTGDVLCRVFDFYRVGPVAVATGHGDTDYEMLASYVSLAARLGTSSLRRRDLRRFKFTVRDEFVPLASAMAEADHVSVLPYFEHAYACAKSKAVRRLLSSASADVTVLSDGACHAFCEKESCRSVINALQPLKHVFTGRGFELTPERVFSLGAARTTLREWLTSRSDAVSTALAFGAMSPFMLARAIQQTPRDRNYDVQVSALTMACAMAWRASRVIRERFLQQVCYAVPADARELTTRMLCCAVCDESFLPMFEATCTSHAVCTPCMVRCVESRAVDVIHRRAWLSTSDMLRCAMSPACGCQMPAADLSLIGVEFRYVVDVLGTEPQPRPGTHPCFQCWDRVELKSPDSGVIGNCATCLAQMCTVCDGMAHPGWLCPAAMRTCTPELVLSEAKTQRCPNCATATTKDSGCNHISCLCKTNWCWICSKTIEGSDTTAHYADGASLCGQFTYGVEYETARMRLHIEARTDVSADVKVAALSLLTSTFAQSDDDL